MPKLIKAWLAVPVEDDYGKGGKGRKKRKGIPQEAPLLPLASNLYMRRFILLSSTDLQHSGGIRVIPWFGPEETSWS